MAFIKYEIVKIYNHDEVIAILAKNLLNSSSWIDKGGYSWGKTPKIYNTIINEI